MAGDRFLIERDGSNLTLEVPEEAFYLSGLQVAKKGITADLQKYFPEIDTISFRETFKKPTETLGSLAEDTPPPSKTSVDPGKAEEIESGEKKEVMEPKKRATAPKARAKASYKSPKAGSENQR